MRYNWNFYVIFFKVHMHCWGGVEFYGNLVPIILKLCTTCDALEYLLNFFIAANVLLSLTALCLKQHSSAGTFTGFPGSSGHQGDGPGCRRGQRNGAGATENCNIQNKGN